MTVAKIVDDDQDKRRISSWRCINNVVGALVSTGHQRQFGAKLIPMATIACDSNQGNIHVTGCMEEKQPTNASHQVINLLNRSCGGWFVYLSLPTKEKRCECEDNRVRNLRGNPVSPNINTSAGNLLFCRRASTENWGSVNDLKFSLSLLAPSGALIAIPTYYWSTHPLFQITPVLNTGLSLSEPLQLYKGYNAI